MNLTMNLCSRLALPVRLPSPRKRLYLKFPTVTLMDVSLKASLTLSSLSGFAMIQRFLSFEKKPKSGPRVLRASHHVLISIMEPAALTSSANQHCFTMDAACRLVIKGWMLKAYRPIASGSPCVVPSADMISFPPMTNSRAGCL